MTRVLIPTGLARRLIRTALLLALAIPASALSAEVAYWRFEEGSGQIAYDSSLSGNQGDLLGDTYHQGEVPVPTVPRTGAPNAYSVRFDGDYDGIRIPDSPSLRPTQGLTIECWIKPEPGGWVIIGKQLYDGYANSYMIEINQNWGGILRFIISDPDGAEHDVWDPEPFPLGEWHHVAGTWDHADLRLYVDGDLVASAPYSGEIGYDDHAILLGADNDGAGEPGCCFFNGAIDELRMFDEALPPTAFLNYANPASVAELEPDMGPVAIRGIHPNPVSSEVTVAYRTLRPGVIDLSLYDVLGRLVSSRSLGWQGAGLHESAWALGGQVAPGLYSLQVRSSGWTAHTTVVKVN